MTARIACFFAFLAAAGEAHVPHAHDHSSIHHKVMLTQVAHAHRDQPSALHSAIRHQPKEHRIHHHDHRKKGTLKLKTVHHNRRARASPNATAPADAQAMEMKTLAPLDEMSGFTNKTDAVDLLDLIYQGHAKHAFWGVNHYDKAVHEARARNISEQDVSAVLYNEVLPRIFVQILGHIGAKPGQQFLDLGSGTGKSVFAAWILGLNATGVEIVNDRWQQSCKMTQRLQKVGFRKPANGPGVTFVHSNFMETDLSNADIIFLNNNAFTDNMVEQIAQQKIMKPGAKIISRKPLPGDAFKLEERFIGPTSQSMESEWNIQTVVAPAKTLTMEYPDPAAEAKRLNQRLHSNPADLDSNPAVATDGGETKTDSSVPAPAAEVKASDSEPKVETIGGASGVAPIQVLLQDPKVERWYAGAPFLRKEAQAALVQNGPATGPIEHLQHLQHQQKLLSSATRASSNICNMEEE